MHRRGGFSFTYPFTYLIANPFTYLIANCYTYPIAYGFYGFKYLPYPIANPFTYHR